MVETLARPLPANLIAEILGVEDTERGGFKLLTEVYLRNSMTFGILDTKRRDRQLTVDFLCEAAGGPTFYTGRNMQTSHAGLGITDSEYDLLMEHCIGTLEKLEVAEAEKADVCAFGCDETGETPCC